MFKGLARSIMGTAALASVVFAAGCGSSEATLTKAEFAQQAKKICQQSQEERTKIVSTVIEQANPNGNVQAQQEEVINKALPSYEEAAQQIDNLGAPKGEEKQVEALVQAMEEAAEKAKSDPHTAVNSNIFFKKANQLLERYELSGCVV